MAKYTTGEIAKLCDVSVRTVQYYDSRKLLVPSELSEGGRRLYSEDDLQKLKIICFLRNLDISINSIGELFEEEEPEKVIAILLEQQKKECRDEINERQKRLQTLEKIERGMREMEKFSLESIGDIAHIVKNAKKLNKIRAIVITVGTIAECMEVATFILWIIKGYWIPFLSVQFLALAVGLWIFKFYIDRIVYICPECHCVFKPKFKEALFAAHTPTTRKLTCIKCGHKGFCVETCEEETKKGD